MNGAPQHLVVMVKDPMPGAVKSRLADGVGDIAAVYFYRHLIAATLTRLSGDARWRTCVAVTPDGVRSIWRLPAHVHLVDQGPGDLGQRLSRLMHELPPGPVVVIGSDIPAISRSDIAHAFKCLGPADVVIGPSPDGGYWLVGQRRSPRVYDLFSGVRWSGPDTLRDTLSNVARLEVAHLPAKRDVDTAEDLVQASKSGLLSPWTV